MLPFHFIVKPTLPLQKPSSSIKNSLFQLILPEPITTVSLVVSKSSEPPGFFHSLLHANQVPS